MSGSLRSSYESSLVLPPGGVVTPIASPEDQRAYRVFTLDNGLTAILVHDPLTDKAAASMDVHVGHFSDPADLPGLAHFLEHMLFLGTAKYPDEGEYAAFLNSHGGSSNAYTSTEDTCYYFDVTKDHLEGALDRFAQFFTAVRTPHTHRARRGRAELTIPPTATHSRSKKDSYYSFSSSLFF